MQDDRDRAARGQRPRAAPQRDRDPAGARPPEHRADLRVVRGPPQARDVHHHGDVHRRRARLADEDAPPRLRREGGGDPRREDALGHLLLPPARRRPPRHQVRAPARAPARARARARRPLPPRRPRPPAPPPRRRRAHRPSSPAPRLDNFIYEDEAEDAELKLIDFGFAVEVAPGREAMWEQIGTPSYMAPELWADHAKEYDSSVRRRKRPAAPKAPARRRPPAACPPRPPALPRRARSPAAPSPLCRWTCGRSAW